MPIPVVSICLPNLNMRPFLAERLESIQNQTFGDWELLIYDSHSDDGSWELLSDAAGRDDRIHAWQGPREGIYTAWNRCIEQAKGKYVYIATSDDTMALDCLEKMVEALEANPNCGLAHCPLKVIDAAGEELVGWWPNHSVFACSHPDKTGVPHVRRAPCDGLLHLTGTSVYVSITQLLIRRPVFDRIGMFDRAWGPIGDFHWNMRASLNFDTVHVPETWASWRRHLQQASAGSEDSVERARRIQAIIDDVLRQYWADVPETLRADISDRWQSYQLDHRIVSEYVGTGTRRLTRGLRLGYKCLGGSRAALAMARQRITRRHSRIDLARQIATWLESRGLHCIVERAPAAAAPRKLPRRSLT